MMRQVCIFPMRCSLSKHQESRCMSWQADLQLKCPLQEKNVTCYHHLHGTHACTLLQASHNTSRLCSHFCQHNPAWGFGKPLTTFH
jgi:hypothetical protein